MCGTTEGERTTLDGGHTTHRAESGWGEGGGNPPARMFVSAPAHKMSSSVCLSPALLHSAGVMRHSNQKRLRGEGFIPVYRSQPIIQGIGKQKP